MLAIFGRTQQRFGVRGSKSEVGVVSNSNVRFVHPLWSKSRGRFSTGRRFRHRNGDKRSGSGSRAGIVFVAYPLSLLSCASKFNYRSGQSVHIALPLLENILSQDYWESSLGARNRFAPRACQTRAQVRTHTRPLYQHPPRVINGFTLGWLLRLTSNKVDNMLGFERALPWLLEHNS